MRVEVLGAVEHRRRGCRDGKMRIIAKHGITEACLHATDLNRSKRIANRSLAGLSFVRSGKRIVRPTAFVVV